jgi:hypothetical protein
LIVRVYIDNLIIAGQDTATIDNLVKILVSVYPIKDLGDPKTILGLYIIYTRNLICIDQKQYIKRILYSYKIDSCKPVAILIEGYKFYIPATPNKPRYNQQLYQQAIGSLLYTAGSSR